MTRLSSSAGIAIGPILFVLALLGVLATVLSSTSGSGFGAAQTADRIAADLSGQANLIRSQIGSCQMQYLITGLSNTSGACAGDSYPCSNSTEILVSALTCPNDPKVDGNEQGLWSGVRPATLPPITRGFNEWKYINAGDSGGRCIWTSLVSTGTKSSSVVDGVTRAKAKFTNAEALYDSTSGTQRFVVFITTPNGGPVDSHCTLNP